MLALLVATLTTLTSSSPLGRETPLTREISSRLQAAAEERLALGPFAKVRVAQLDAAQVDAFTRGRLLSLELASRGEPLGWVTARATILHKKKERDVWLRAEIVATGPTVIAARPIARGAIITDADLRVDERPLDADQLDQPELAVGAIARWPVATGEPLSKRGLDKPAVVSRGAAVQVVVSQPGFIVKASGEALDSGAIGQEVAVKVGSHKVLRGIVSAPGEVEVRW